MRKNSLRRFQGAEISLITVAVLAAFGLAADSPPAKPDTALSPDIIRSRVECELDIASHFYWLGLAEEGNCRAFERGLKRLNIAQHWLNQRALPDRVPLQTQLDALRGDLESQMELAGENFYGGFPLVRLIDQSLFVDDETSGTFELLDSADEVAVERATAAFRETVVTQWKSITPVAVVLVSEPEDPLLENQAATVLNQSPEFYVHRSHELVPELTRIQQERRALALLDRDVRARLFASFKTSHLLIVILKKHPLAADPETVASTRGVFVPEIRLPDAGPISCYTIEGLAYEPDKDEAVRSIITRGFCRNRRGRLWLMIGMHIALYLLAVALHAQLVVRRMRSWPTWWRMLLAPSIAFLIGRFSPWLFVPLIKSFAPDAHTILPVSFWWPCALGIGLLMGPLILCWLAANNVPGLRSLLWFDRHGGAICATAGLGIAAYVVTLLLLFYEPKEFLTAAYLISGAIVAFGAISYLFGRCLDRIDALDPLWLALFIALSAWLGIALCLISPLAVWLCCAACLIPGISERLSPRRDEPVDPSLPEPPPRDADELARRAQNPPYLPLGRFHEAVKHVDQLLRGRACCLSLVGPPGCGKTATAHALINHLCQQINSPNRLLVLEASCSPNDSNATPYGPFRTALSKVFSVNLLAPPEEQLKGLPSALESFLGSVVPFANVLFPSADSRPERANSQNALFAAILQAIHGRAKTQTVVLFIDDIQWIDNSSRELLKYLIENRRRSLPLLIMTACRTDAQQTDVMPPGLDFLEPTLGVRTPTAAEQEQILTAKLGFAERSAKRLVACLGQDPHEKGQLFWLFRAVVHLADERALEKTDDGFVFTSTYRNDSDIPMSNELRCELARQLEKSTRHRPILACAACIGREFHAGILADSLNMDRLETLQTLDTIERETGIVADVRAKDDAYCFSSTFMLEVIREELGIGSDRPTADDLPQIIREYHARVAAVLERTLQHRSGVLFEVARHYCSAGQAYAEKGLEHSLRAVSAAREIFDFDQARLYLDMARDRARILGRSSRFEDEELLIDCEEAHVTGDYQLSRQSSEKALDYEKRHPDASCRMLRTCARACYDAAGGWHETDRYRSEANRLGKLIVERFQEPKCQATGQHFIGISYPYGESVLRQKHLRQAMQLVKDVEADDVEGQRLFAEVTNSLAEQLSHGTPQQQGEARELFLRSLEIKQKYHDLPGQARTLGGLGRLARRAEPIDTVAAQDYFKQDLAISEEINDVRGQVKMHSLLCESYHEDGEYDLAVRHGEASWNLAEDPTDISFAGSALIDCYCHQDRLEDAARIGKRLLEMSKNGQTPQDVAERLLAVLKNHAEQLAADWATGLCERAKRDAKP